MSEAALVQHLLEAERAELVATAVAGLEDAGAWGGGVVSACRSCWDQAKGPTEDDQ